MKFYSYVHIYEYRIKVILNKIFVEIFARDKLIRHLHCYMRCQKDDLKMEKSYGKPFKYIKKYVETNKFCMCILFQAEN